MSARRDMVRLVASHSRSTLPAGHRVQTVCPGDSDLDHLELGYTKFDRRLLDRGSAEVDAVARGLAVRILEGKRLGVGPVADPQLAGFFGPLEHASLRPADPGTGQHRCRDDHSHADPP